MSETKKSQNIVQGFDPKTDSVGNGAQSGSKSVNLSGSQVSNHWEIRTEEQPYAFLSDREVFENNRYGQPIDLVDFTGQPANRSMFINDNAEVGSNPNRNKQHGFFFTADNCIGCHACEAACSEKNENPAHLAFRSVGYVEGGSYPDYKRMNISMACNHCDDPVCLKGCPTGAYTKHVEYGAVLQDPETCFGCGYCTWVCPYNAPQLDPIKGQVSKCNMCVDRLEVGLKPACVSACVGNALDFGVIENTPENREQCKTQIPGFPDPEITHPNVRFQQTKTLPDDMVRTDAVPIKYHKDKHGNYLPMVDQKLGKKRSWNLAKLNSRENPLVLFTLFCQAAFGAFAIVFMGAVFGNEALTAFVGTDMFTVLALMAVVMTGFGLFMSVTHLGKPFRFYRGFNNLRYSPMSREGLGLAMFAGGAGLTFLFSLPNNDMVNSTLHAVFDIDLLALIDLLPLGKLMLFSGIFAVIAGCAGLYYMFKCYRIKARPFWNHWQTATAFAGNSLSLGAFVAGLLIVMTLVNTQAETSNIQSILIVLGATLIVGLALEGIGLCGHHRDMTKGQHEGSASHYVQCTTFGKTYVLRNIVLASTIVLAIVLLWVTYTQTFSMSLAYLWLLLGLSSCFTAAIGRAFFYILVIPTTMPGAFFWKNKSFEQHARDIGLADRPSVGVAPLH